MVSTLELLMQHESVKQAVATIVIVTTLHCAVQKILKRRKRVVQLDGWIKAARKEREVKVHIVLSRRKTTVLEEEAYPLYSAAKTRALIVTNKLDPAENVEMLAKRCRKYGRDESRVNAITEEFYEEVRSIVLHYSNLIQQKTEHF